MPESMLESSSSIPLVSTRLHSSPLDSTRLHSTPLDSTRLHLTPLDSTRLHLTPHDSTRLHLTPHDSTRRHLTPHDSTWIYSDGERASAVEAQLVVLSFTAVGAVEGALAVVTRLRGRRASSERQMRPQHLVGRSVVATVWRRKKSLSCFLGVCIHGRHGAEATLEVD